MTWNEVLLNLVNTLFRIMITVGIPYLFSIISKRIKVDIQLKYLNKFEEIVISAVTQVQQTYVDEIRKAGSFDKVAQATAFCKARDAVLKMLDEKTKEIVTEAVGDFEAYMKNKIEESVHNMKVFEK